MRRPRPPAAFSLVELLATLTLLGVLIALAGPALVSYVQRERARSALERLVGDLFHARMLASRLGTRLHVRFAPASGCATVYTISRADNGRVLRQARVQDEAPGVCLSSNVSRAISIDSRGLLVGSARTIFVQAGSQRDSAVISLVGRVLRAP